METNSTDNDGLGFSPPVRSIDLTLTVAICTVAGMILVGNSAFLCRRRRPKEGAVNILLLDNLAGSNIGLVVYLSGLVTGDFLHHNGHLSAASLQILCNVEGVLGILFSELSLWLSLTITISMFARQVCPRRMRRGKDYLPVYKVIAIAEWMTALILAGFPPALSIFFSKDHAPTVTTYHEVLCLPKGSKTEHKLEFTLFLNCAIVLTIFVCLSAVPCCIRGQLKKASLPMEERIIKRDAAVFARMGAAVLIIAIPWVPALVMFAMTYFGIRIRQTVLQWTLWCVLPSGPAMFPAVYVIVMESTRCRHLLKSCRDKWRKGEKYSLKLRELTSQMSLPSLASKTCLRESTLMKEGVAAAAVGEAPSEVEWTELLQPCAGPHDQLLALVLWSGEGNSIQTGTLKLYHPTQARRWDTEVQMAAKLAVHQSPNIIRYLWNSDDHTTKVLHVPNNWVDQVFTRNKYICIQTYEHGSLRFFLLEHLGLLTDLLVQIVATEITKGLAHLQSIGIVHNSLSAASVLIGGDMEHSVILRVAISDFDSCKEAPVPDPPGQDATTADAIGSSTSGTCSTYDIDIRSLALILLEMLARLRSRSWTSPQRTRQFGSGRRSSRLRERLRVSGSDQETTPRLGEGIEDTSAEEDDAFGEVQLQCSGLRESLSYDAGDSRTFPPKSFRKDSFNLTTFMPECTEQAESVVSTGPSSSGILTGRGRRPDSANSSVFNTLESNNGNRHVVDINTTYNSTLSRSDEAESDNKSSYTWPNSVETGDTIYSVESEGTTLSKPFSMTDECDNDKNGAVFEGITQDSLSGVRSPENRIVVQDFSSIITSLDGFDEEEQKGSDDYSEASTIPAGDDNHSLCNSQPSTVSRQGIVLSEASTPPVCNFDLFLSPDTMSAYLRDDASERLYTRKPPRTFSFTQEERLPSAVGPHHLRYWRELRLMFPWLLEDPASLGNKRQLQKIINVLRSGLELRKLLQIMTQCLVSDPAPAVEQVLESLRQCMPSTDI
ncbi:RXFP2 [Branchiostoma lanceolatum]|uniref:RXFP2 protein n=1 Tax=Branchiostoma lanceolatum TaxID=7740 RepID=A0A8S4MPF5_BRALA|nr:RXFP2 [Branchiostoma lanceolatum]